MCGISGTGCHATEKSFICAWGILYKSGVYAEKVCVLPRVVCKLYSEELMPKQLRMIGMQKSEKGIVVWHREELFRHSRRKREEQVS
jgi:hypothetical protein